MICSLERMTGVCIICVYSTNSNKHMCDELAHALLWSKGKNVSFTNTTCLEFATRVAKSANTVLKSATGPNADHTQLLIAALIMIVVTEEFVRRTLNCIWRMRTRKRRRERGRSKSTDTHGSGSDSEHEDDPELEMREARRVPAPADSDEDATLALRGEGVHRI